MGNWPHDQSQTQIIGLWTDSGPKRNQSNSLIRNEDSIICGLPSSALELKSPEGHMNSIFHSVHRGARKVDWQNGRIGCKQESGDAGFCDSITIDYQKWFYIWHLSIPGSRSSSLKASSALDFPGVIIVSFQLFSAYASADIILLLAAKWSLIMTTLLLFVIHYLFRVSELGKKET